MCKRIGMIGATNTGKSVKLKQITHTLLKASNKDIYILDAKDIEFKEIHSPKIKIVSKDICEVLRILKSNIAKDIILVDVSYLPKDNSHKAILIADELGWYKREYPKEYNELIKMIDIIYTSPISVSIFEKDIADVSLEDIIAEFK